jgi:hypothetical protein
MTVKYKFRLLLTIKYSKTIYSLAPLIPDLHMQAEGSSSVAEAGSPRRFRLRSSSDDKVVRPILQVDMVESLKRLLRSYCVCHPRVQYTQGMNYIGAMLLRFLPEDRATVVFIRMMGSYQLSQLFHPDGVKIQLCFHQLGILLSAYLPRLASYLTAMGIVPSIYAAPWFMTLFSSFETLPLATVKLFWDDFLTFGWKSLFRFTLALLRRLEGPILINGSDFGSTLKMLHQLPIDDITGENLVQEGRKYKVTRRMLRQMELQYKKG